MRLRDADAKLNHPPTLDSSANICTCLEVQLRSGSPLDSGAPLGQKTRDIAGAPPRRPASPTSYLLPR